MAIDLNGLSAQELSALIAQAEKRKHTLSKRKPIAAVRKALTAQAAAAGYTIAELFGGAAPKARSAVITTPASGTRKTTKGRKLGKVAPKYRNPADAKQTWPAAARNRAGWPS